MLAVISPAKSLNYAVHHSLSISPSKPFFLYEANHIAESSLKSKTTSDFKKLMKLSDELAKRTYDEYQSYHIDKSCQNTSSRSYSEDIANVLIGDSKFTMAGLLFDGPAYRALNCETLEHHELEQGSKCVRFLSGLYGMLKMGDLIQNHRLEMSTNIKIDTCKNLYEYWRDKISNNIIQESELYFSTIASTTTPKIFLLLNIASDEYFKVIDINTTQLSSTSANDIKIVDCVFLDKGKVISVYAKRARGLMARYICTNQELINVLSSTSSSSSTSVFDLIRVIQEFNVEGYEYDSNTSKVLTGTERSTLVFNRTVVPTTMSSAIPLSGDSSSSSRSSKRSLISESTPIIEHIINTSNNIDNKNKSEDDITTSSAPLQIATKVDPQIKHPITREIKKRKSKYNDESCQ